MKMGLTHTVTHTAKCLKSVGEDMRSMLSDLKTALDSPGRLDDYAIGQRRAISRLHPASRP